MSSISFNVDIDQDMYEIYRNEYESGNYASAIRTAFLYLSECLRERTDLDLDGEKLITTAFSVKKPLIKLNDLKTESEKNEQAGMMSILQGMYKAIRNPRSHNYKVDSKEECDSILIFINYLIKIIKKAKGVFDYKDFLEILNDIHFDKSIKYSEEIIKSIPNEKIYDISIMLLDEVLSVNFENISRILKTLFSLFDEKQKSDFSENISKILLKTKNYDLIKCSILALKGNWELVSPASRMRVENILIDALKNMDFTYETGANEYGDYEGFMNCNIQWELSKYLNFIVHKLVRDESEEEILDILEMKLKQSEESRDYILTSFKEVVLIENREIPANLKMILLELLGDGSDAVQRFLDHYIQETDDKDQSIIDALEKEREKTNPFQSYEPF